MIDLFTTGIHKANNSELADSLYDACKKALDEISNDDEYENGKTTFFNLNVIKKYKEFDAFYNFINEELNKYIENLNIDKTNLNLKFKGVWVSEMYKHGNHGLHVHTNGSIFSGNFYVYAPENSGELSFNRHEWMSDPWSLIKFTKHDKYNSVEWNFKPVKGDLYIWKSDLPHRVKNNKNDSRIAISFNIGFDE